MNDDPTTTSSGADETAAAGSAADGASGVLNVESLGPDVHAASAELRGRKLAQTQKKVDLLDHLLRSLDVVVYCEISALYYMDLIQVFYLTPKPPSLPSMPGPTPSVGAIFGSNAICLLSHLLYASPEAGEATRGYLHGGLLTDFVGYKGPTSKLHLTLLDLLILALQVCMLAVRVDRYAQDTSTSSTTSTGEPESTATNATNSQTHDAEERGIRATEISDAEGIELQPLRSRSDNGEGSSSRNAVGDQQAGEDDADRDLLLPSGSEAPAQDHALDAFLSGQVIVANLNIPNTIRSQWRAYENRPPASAESSAVDTAGSGSHPPGVMAAAWAGRRLGFQVRIGGRRVGP
ncbi:MAG: Protein phosphatase methylesterase 1 [Chaenotheca gracillima]|nr:MAG: Protein phosphatase methylesterase 1 [Chaenotheca gracillima]